MRIVRCKKYHWPLRRRRSGVRSDEPGTKSRCPGWAADPHIQQVLPDEALSERNAPTDSRGRPKRLWNAVAGTVFVGVSTNEEEAAYNCYPEVAASELFPELARRSSRTIDQLLGDEGRA